MWQKMLQIGSGSESVIPTLKTTLIDYNYLAPNANKTFTIDVNKDYVVLGSSNDAGNKSEYRQSIYGISKGTIETLAINGSRSAISATLTGTTLTLTNIYSTVYGCYTVLEMSLE